MRETSTSITSIWLRRAVVATLVVVATVVTLPLLWVGFTYVYAWGAGRFWDRAQHEVHLIPQGYVGPVVIVLDQPDGEAQAVEGDARLYRIPANGVLRTQWRFNEGWGAPDWFYVDSEGRRTPIAGGAQCLDSLPPAVIRACWMGVKTRSDRSPVARYSGYIVSPGPVSTELWQRGDSLVDVVIFRDP